MAQSSGFIQSVTNINDLNDHVLRVAFAHLSVTDLLEVADVSMRFKLNARAVVSTRYKNKQFYVSAERRGIRIDIDWEPRFEPFKIFSLFRNFGDFINFVSLARGIVKEAMGLINEYCGESLNGMRLYDLEFTAADILEMQRVLPRLTTLELLRCSWESESVAVEMFSFCSKLQDFRISNLHSAGSVNLKFPGGVAFSDLRSFSFSNDYVVTTESVQNLLQASPQLKEINLKRCGRIGGDIFPAIVQHAPQIESISIEFHYYSTYLVTDAKCLSRLPALKKLEMGCRYESFSPVIAELVSANVPLETLHLVEFSQERETFDAISRLKNLKKLQLDKCGIFLGFPDRDPVRVAFSDDMIVMISRLSELTHLDLEVDALFQIVQIVRCAPKLRELKFKLPSYPAATFDESLYMEILDVVTSRRNDCHLQIERLDRSLTLDVPQELLEANADKLTIRI